MSIVYQKYSREIYVYLYTMCRDSAVAEDICQETFLKAILSLPDSHANVRAWLYKVARNLLINHLKKTRRETVSDPDADMKDPSPGPDEEVLASVRDAKLYEALTSLDGVKREIILLQYFSQIPLKDIANMTGLSHENVRVISHRAKKELKKYMEEHGYEVP